MTAKQGSCLSLARDWLRQGHDVLRIEGPNGAAIDKHQILLEQQPARARPRGWRAWRLARRTLESRMSHRPAARKAGPQNLPR